MWAKITCRNYRCFPDSSPLCFDLRPGISAFVGVNNSGKSSILKFFYEFRELWRALSNMNNILDPLNHRVTGTSITGVSDTQEIFSNENNRDITITFDVIPEDDEFANWLFVDRLGVTLSRESLGFTLDLWLNGKKISADASFEPVHHDVLMVKGEKTDLRPLFDYFISLSEMFYIGPFRNALNLDGANPYFDLSVAKPSLRNGTIIKPGLKRVRTNSFRTL